MGYDPKAIANFFIELAASKGENVTPMKLQKLDYFAHGWYAAIKDAPLLNEQVEAWKFGPVVPSLYRDLRYCGDGPVNERAFKWVVDDFDEPQRHAPAVDANTAEGRFVVDLLTRVWELYGGYTAIQLSNLTHLSGTPWYQVNSDYQGEIPRGTDIPFNVIRDYFRSQAKTAVRADA